MKKIHKIDTEINRIERSLGVREAIPNRCFICNQIAIPEISDEDTMETTFFDRKTDKHYCGRCSGWHRELLYDYSIDDEA